MIGISDVAISTSIPKRNDTFSTGLMGNSPLQNYNSDTPLELSSEAVSSFLSGSGDRATAISGIGDRTVQQGAVISFLDYTLPDSLGSIPLPLPSHLSTLTDTNILGDSSSSEVVSNSIDNWMSHNFQTPAHMLIQRASTKTETPSGLCFHACSS